MGRGKSFEQSDLRLAAVEPGVMVLDSISGRGIGIYIPNIHQSRLLFDNLSQKLYRSHAYLL